MKYDGRGLQRFSTNEIQMYMEYFDMLHIKWYHASIMWTYGDK